MAALRNKLLAIAALIAVGIPRAECFSRAPAPTRFRAGNRRSDVGPLPEQRAPAKDPMRIVVEGEEEDDRDADDLVDALTARLGEVEGLWYSDDFYGPHGREWVKVAATLVGDEAAARALVAVKVTGDPNVPAGCVTFKTGSWPNVGGSVPAEIHVRADPNDPDGFSWLPGELALVAKDQMELVVRYNLLMSGGGTFYRKSDEESSE